MINNQITTHSWFSIHEQREKEKQELSTSEIARSWLNEKDKYNKTKDNTIIKSKKYKLNLSLITKNKLNIYFNDRIDMYNEVIKFIRPKINKHNYLLKEIKQLLNFQDLRTNYLLKKKDKIVSKHNFNPHCLDLTIKTACAMIKSALSNYTNYIKDRKRIHESRKKDREKEKEKLRLKLIKNPNYIQKKTKNHRLKKIKFPYMKLLLYNKRKKTIELPKDCFTSKKDKSGFLLSQLKDLNIEAINTYTNKKFLLNKNNIKCDSILQYDSKKNEYYLFIPEEEKTKYIFNKNEKIGIDLGVRTFATIYSGDENNKIISEISKDNEIFNNIKPNYNKIDKLKQQEKELKLKIKQTIHKKGDVIERKKNKKTRKKIHKLIIKENDKIANKIKELHLKTANYLCRNFQTIHLGKINAKSIVTNSTTNSSLNRLIYSISFYKFRQIIENKAKEYNVDLKLINEYLTSQECSNCGKIKKDLGKNKIYKCNKKSCKYNINPIDRDVNAAINIYNREK
jgi:IS605 OrfB family transposase